VLESSPPWLIREAQDHTGRGPKARLAALAARATASTASAKAGPCATTSWRRASRASAQVRKCRQIDPALVPKDLNQLCTVSRVWPRRAATALWPAPAALALGELGRSPRPSLGAGRRTGLRAAPTFMASPTTRPARPVPLGQVCQARRASPGVASGPQFSFAVRASQMPSPQRDIDNPSLVPYDEQSGALRASQGTRSLSAKR
jgi:hypothetical protein